jgi:hypothetical protein
MITKKSGRISAAHAAESEQKARQQKMADFSGRVMTLVHHCYD